MENKYYVPEIEEFHVGFEYEYVTNMAVPTDDDSKWDSFLFGDQEKFKSWDWRLLLQDCLKRKLIRVKCINREDIEEFGWELDSVVEKEAFFIHNSNSFSSQEEWMLVFREKESSIEIYSTKKDTVSFSFYGIAKNKSELKKLLAQLNII